METVAGSIRKTHRAVIVHEACLTGGFGAELAALFLADRLVAAMAECGCTLNNAYMQHSLLALVVIPELRISDLGLVDVTRFELTDLFEATP